jgi:hypothetical protein
MTGKTALISLSVLATGICIYAINITLQKMPQNQPAIMKLKKNKFLTPGFVYVKMGIYKDGSAFESYTFSEGIPIKNNIQQKAESELKDYTGCIDVNVETKKSKDGSKHSSIQKITDFKKIECPDLMK